MHISSPLNVRATLRRVRLCPDPGSTLFHLLWPFPLRYPLPSPLLSVKEIQERPEIHDEQHTHLPNARYSTPVTVSTVWGHMCSRLHHDEL